MAGPYGDAAGVTLAVEGLQLRAADGHLTFTMTFTVSLWPAGSGLYIVNGPPGPQLAVIAQGHYQGCAQAR